jgi:ubiquinone/menaquinone biosynthesis C-methylase UbiE
LNLKTVKAVKMKKPQSEIESSYDSVAEPYAEEYFAELEKKPFDRGLLDGFAETMHSRGAVCEIGCGPGQVARYLHDRGVKMHGIDLSQEMVAQARRLNPDISFDKGDMRALDLPDVSLAGIVSFYAIIHLKREDVVPALKEMRRVLKQGGKLMLSFHGGEGEIHRDEWYDKPVSVDVTLFEKKEMAGYLAEAGFEVERIADREPYEFEFPTRRVYAFARKPFVGR